MWKQLITFPKCLKQLVHNLMFYLGTLIDIVGDQGGTREIENIKVGDAVWTYNHESNQRELKSKNL